MPVQPLHLDDDHVAPGEVEPVDLVLQFERCEGPGKPSRRRPGSEWRWSQHLRHPSRFKGVGTTAALATHQRPAATAYTFFHASGPPGSQGVGGQRRRPRSTCVNVLAYLSITYSPAGGGTYSISPLFYIVDIGSFHCVILCWCVLHDWCTPLHNSIRQFWASARAWVCVCVLLLPCFANLPRWFLFQQPADRDESSNPAPEVLNAAGSYAVVCFTVVWCNVLLPSPTQKNFLGLAQCWTNSWS